MLKSLGASVATRAAERTGGLLPPTRDQKHLAGPKPRINVVGALPDQPPRRIRRAVGVAIRQCGLRGLEQDAGVVGSHVPGLFQVFRGTGQAVNAAISSPRQPDIKRLRVGRNQAVQRVIGPRGVAERPAPQCGRPERRASSSGAVPQCQAIPPRGLGGDSAGVLATSHQFLQKSVSRIQFDEYPDVNIRIIISSLPDEKLGQSAPNVRAARLSLEYGLECGKHPSAVGLVRRRPVEEPGATDQRRAVRGPQRQRFSHCGERLDVATGRGKRLGLREQQNGRPARLHVVDNSQQAARDRGAQHDR